MKDKKTPAVITADIQDLVLQPIVLTIGDLVSYKQSNQITIPAAYQRRYQEWPTDKYSSFIIGNWRGFSAKDSYLIVDVQACYDNEIKSECPDKDFLAHLKGYLDVGHVLLTVDGQHRMESNTSYINGKLIKFPKGVDRVLIYNDNKISLDIDFMSLTQTTREFYLNQPVQVSMIVKASLPSLKKLFVTANDGRPLSNIEKAMAGNAPNAVDGVLDVVSVDHYREFINRIAKVDSRKKQDCELLAKFLMYELDRENVDVLPAQLPYIFHTDLDGFKPTSKTDIKRLHKNFSKVYDTLSPNLLEKGQIPIGRVINLYMLISLLTDGRQHSIMDKFFNSNVRFKIDNPKGFGDWFLKSELVRMSDRYLVDKEGKQVMVQQMDKKLNLIEVPVDNTAGYYYATSRESNGTFMTRRQNDMVRDFKEFFESSKAVGIVKAIDTTKVTKSVREKVLVESNFTTSTGKELSWGESMNGNSFHVDHITARDNQGSTDVSNLQMMDSKSNINKSNREI